MAVGPSLVIACGLAASIYGLLALGFGVRGKRDNLLGQGRAAVAVVAGALGLASAILVFALAGSDFRYAYVAEHTSRAIPLAYKVAAFWAGQEGSFLLWGLVLSWYAVYVSAVTWRRAPELAARALVVMLGVNVFFLLILLAEANPFLLASPVPEDGAGLNPLLQNFGMLAHPLALYLGFVGFAVPFAFAVAEMLGGSAAGSRPAAERGGRGKRGARAAGAKGARKVESRLPAAPAEVEESTAATAAAPTWLALSRSFTVFSWLFLSIGIILGMQWAYVELGWGGYWAWDPVENASLIPWLTATAFLHSALVQERKGNLAGVNVLLIDLTFLLTIFGTFLTRTGVVSSVHAFASSGLVVYFLPFLVLGLGLSVYAAAVGWKRLKNSKPLGSLLSREAAVILAVILFGILTLTVLWGTVFPLVSKAFGGREVAVDASYYIRAAVPVGAAVIFLLAACQALGWSRNLASTFGRRLTVPVALGVLLTGFLLVALRPGSCPPSAVAGIGGGALAAFSGLAGLARDTASRRSSTGEGPLRAVSALIELNPRRYGALLVHLAMACMVVGFAGTVYRQETAVTLQPDETAEVAGYDLTFRGLGAEHLDYRVSVVARLELTRGGRVYLLEPEKQYYANYESPFSEVAVLGGLGEDVYTVLDGWTAEGSASFRVFREPLVAWIWIGGYLLVAGTLVLAWPRALGLGRKPAAGRGRAQAARAPND